MALKAADLISGASLLALPFGGPNVVFPGQLLRLLHQLDREVVGMYQMEAPERVSSNATSNTLTTTLTITSALNITGYPLIPSEMYTEFLWVDADGHSAPIYMCTEKQIDNAPRHPAGTVRGTSFFPADPLHKGWADSTSGRFYFTGNGDTIRYRYVPFPAALTTDQSSLSSPDEAEPYLLAALKLYILLNDPMVPQTTLQMASSDKTKAYTDLRLLAVKRTRE